MEALTTKKNDGRFQKGSAPWNKGIEYLKGEKHPMFGKHHRPESIQKMKESLKGRVPSNLGKAMSEEQKIKISLSKKGQKPWNTGMKLPGIGGRKPGGIPWNKYMTGLSTGFPKGQHNTKIAGENHYAWKGGVSSENKKVRDSLEMRMACADSKERDNYTCQMPECGIRGGKLHSHHVKPFRSHLELRFEISNLITLCEECHRKVNYNESRYEELFTNIIKLK